MKLIGDLLIIAFSFSFITKVVIHYYLDFRSDFNLVDLISFKNVAVRYLSFYKKKEQGNRNILKSICNLFLKISVVLFILYLVYSIFFIFFS